MVGNNTTIPVAGMSRTVMLINRSSELYPLLTRQRYTPPYSAQPSESLAGSLIVSVFCGPLMVSFSDLFWTLTSYNSPVCASRSSLYQVELTGVLSSDLAEHLKLISAASLCPIVSSTSLRAINSVFSETFAHTANRYSIPVLLILGRKCTQAVWTPHCYITLTTRRGQRNESRGSMVAPRVGQRACDQKRSVRVGLPVGALLCKAPSTPATMSKQHCRMLQCRISFDIVAVFGNNVEATFDFVAKNGNNVERDLRRNFVLSTKSNVASTLLPKTATLSTKQQATLLPVASTMLLRHCC